VKKHQDRGRNCKAFKNNEKPAMSEKGKKVGERSKEVKNKLHILPLIQPGGKKGNERKEWGAAKKVRQRGEQIFEEGS